MAREMSRRQFFDLIGAKLRKPIRVALLLAIAWLAIAVFQSVRGITLHGWTLIGCLVLAAIVFAAIRFGARRVYSLLPSQGKALCAATGEVFDMLACVAIGAFLWHRWQTEDATGIVVVIFVGIADRAYRMYNQRLGELNRREGIRGHQ